MLEGFSNGEEYAKFMSIKTKIEEAEKLKTKNKMEQDFIKRCHDIPGGSKLLEGLFSTP